MIWIYTIALSLASYIQDAFNFYITFLRKVSRESYLRLSNKTLRSSVSKTRLHRPSGHSPSRSDGGPRPAYAGSAQTFIRCQPAPKQRDAATPDRRHGSPYPTCGRMCCTGWVTRRFGLWRGKHKKSISRVAYVIRLDYLNKPDLSPMRLCRGIRYSSPSLTGFLHLPQLWHSITAFAGDYT